MSKKYHKGKLPKLWDFLVHLHREQPNAFSSPEYLKAVVAQRWKDLRNEKKCPNCKANMITYHRKVDYFIVTLIVSMARIVRHRLDKGTPFTKANQVHVNADERIPHNSRNMTGIASALGLIAPVEGEGAYWAITKRGWAALRGEEIPASIITFRDEIIERPEETTTFADAMRRSKKENVGVYEPNEWVTFAGLHEGNLL